VVTVTPVKRADLPGDRAQFALPEPAADLHVEVLRHVHVADVALGPEHLPHAGEVRITSQVDGKEHAVHEVEVVRDGEFHDAARDVQR